MARINTTRAQSANSILNDKLGSFFGSEILQSKAGIRKAQILAEKKRKKRNDIINSALVVANIALPGISAVKDAKMLAKIGATKVGADTAKTAVVNSALKTGATKYVAPKINIFKEFSKGVLRQNKASDLYNITTSTGETLQNVPRYVLNMGKNIKDETERLTFMKELMGGM